ncbi:methionyl-tRNA formyltransferase [bacterium]|nr:methionyl-tRNA formyltransferase [bacterium]
MGTPEFAVPSLHSLATAGHDIAAVVTRPDTLRGRGQKISSTPVKREALDLGLPVLEPESLSDPRFIDALSACEADCFVVVAFRILPEAVFSLPPRGAFNLHASLLPAYRGAAPIQWAIINGETRTGVTTFFLEKTVDTGGIILQRETEIFPGDTAGTLHDRLMAIGSEAVTETASLIERGAALSLPQSGTASRAPKIDKEHCLIDWRLPTERIRNHIRGLSPCPGAFTYWNCFRIKLYESEQAGDHPDVEGGRPPGTVLCAGRGGLIVQTGDGALSIGSLQLQGKSRLPAGDFIRGSALQAGDCFTSEPVFGK